MSNRAVQQQHWASAVAVASVDREAKAKTDRDAVEAQRRELMRLVAVEGPIYVGEVGKGMRAAASAYNTPIRRDEVVVSEQPHLTSMRARSSGLYVQCAWDIRTEERVAPGVVVSVCARSVFCTDSRPFDFVTDNGALAVGCDRELLDAAAFVRRMTESWFAGLPLEPKPV